MDFEQNLIPKELLSSKDLGNKISVGRIFHTSYCFTYVSGLTERRISKTPEVCSKKSGAAMKLSYD